MENKHIQIDLASLEKFNDLIRKEPFTFKTITIEKNKKKIKYQYFNLLATCVVRIRETTQYINQKELIRKNVCGQAFDFYELICLSSIIVDCVEKIFFCFNHKNISNFPKRSIFKMSNKTKMDDLKFFKFIRSATAVHPANTDRYRKYTKNLNEFYPYVYWIGDIHYFIFKNLTKDYDITLKKRNSRTMSIGGHYLLKTSEFYEFIQCIINALDNLFSDIESIRNEYVNAIRFKKIKSEKCFKNYSSYLMYLYRRLRKIHGTSDFHDAGLVLASGLFKNKLISKEFKNYIKINIKKVIRIMYKNPELVEEENVFDSLYDTKCFVEINPKEGAYISQKFTDYLFRDVKYSILNNKKEFIKKDDNFANDSYFVYRKLEAQMKSLYVNNELELAKTYEDVLFITLQAVYLYWRRKEKK